MINFLKNKKILNNLTVDIIFYLFIIFGFPAIAIIAFKYKLSIFITGLIYSFLMVSTISLKAFYDSKKIENIFFKESK